MFCSWSSTRSTNVPNEIPQLNSMQVTPKGQPRQAMAKGRASIPAPTIEVKLCCFFFVFRVFVFENVTKIEVQKGGLSGSVLHLGSKQSLTQKTERTVALRLAVPVRCESCSSLVCFFLFGVGFRLRGRGGRQRRRQRKRRRQARLPRPWPPTSTTSATLFFRSKFSAAHEFFLGGFPPTQQCRTARPALIPVFSARKCISVQLHRVATRGRLASGGAGLLGTLGTFQFLCR